MNTLSCPDMTADLVRGWLEDRLDVARAAEVRRHLRECPSCFKTLMGTTSKKLFAVLSEGNTARVASFKEQVSTTLAQKPVKAKPAVAIPLSERLQQLLAATRELLWEPFVSAPFPSPGTLSAARVTVQEVDASGAPIGSVVVLSSRKHFENPPILTSAGRFRFVLRGSDARWVGKQLTCEIKLLEDQIVALGAPIQATSSPAGWEAVFDEEVLTDPETKTQEDYSIPLDYLKLVVHSPRS